MIEVLWHGRGGQGAFTAARLLGAAASFSDDAYALAFPSFGPERRGAPMRAFTKMDERPIGNRSAITRADYVVYLDDTLLSDDWESELKPGGMVLVNSAKTFADPRIVAIDAHRLSIEVLGRPIPNTVFLGVIAALCERVSLDDARASIGLYMAPKIQEKNVRLVEAAFAQVVERAGSDVSAGEAAENAAVVASEPAAARSAEPAAEQPRRRACRISSLHDGIPAPEVYARTTCFDAGYLVVKNAGWRSIRPVIDQELCTRCLQCYLLCPDGAVFKVGPSEEDAKRVDVAVDYDFCKGCGVCVKACPAGALSMIPEQEASAR